MPIFRRGNMFQNSPSAVKLATANAYIRTDGALVMGRGAAYQMKCLYPGVEYIFGNKILTRKSAAVSDIFGSGYWIILIDKPAPLGIFQVKHHFRTQASPALIYKSALMLATIAGDNPDQLYAVNFPGIGNGGLRRELVLPILSILPDNVEVWEL